MVEVGKEGRAAGKGAKKSGTILRNRTRSLSLSSSHSSVLVTRDSDVPGLWFTLLTLEFFSKEVW